MQKYSNMVRAPRHPPTPSSIWMLLSQQQGFISTQAHTHRHTLVTPDRTFGQLMTKAQQEPTDPPRLSHPILLEITDHSTLSNVSQGIHSQWQPYQPSCI